jgi:dihydrolipoamide dehydrogenase
MAETLRTGVVVIGGGPGGYAAAFRAADLGLSVALVEAEERLGGACLLRGCIPSKALLHVAGLIAEAREAERWGVAFSTPKVDLSALRQFKDGVIGKMVGGLAGLARQRKVRHIVGRAAFESSSKARIEGSDEVSGVEFEHAIVATGSRPATIPLFDIGSPRVMDSTTALDLPEVPARLLVVGGGYIGLELGTVYAELGSRVSVVEATDGILPGADRDLVRPLQSRLEGRFAGIHLKTSVKHLEDGGNGLTVTFEGAVADKVQDFDRLLVSIGRRPNTERLGLENTGVQVSARGFIEVDRQQRTADPRIFAIGDAAGGGLAHAASHQGRVAAEVLAGEAASFDQAVPAVVFTDPEIAWVGLTETEAARRGKRVEVARCPWAAVGRTATLGRSDGLTKLVVEPFTHRILGVGIVGPGAGELIGEGALAVETAAVVEDIAGTIHTHPTLSESIGIAAEIYLGAATDVYLPRRK